MPDTRTVDAPIPIEAAVAPALGDAATRALAGRLTCWFCIPGAA